MMSLDPDILESWEAYISKWDKCTACEIASRATQKVFTRGHLPCDILFIGEGPGKTEDVVGEPFVGLAGKILQRWINDSFPPGLLYTITNVVLCRPCDKAGGPNRAPQEAEIANCSGHLSKVIEISKPKALVFLGKVAGLHRPRFEGKTLELRHPAYILRTGVGGTEDLDQVVKLKTFAKEIACQR